MKSVRVRGAVHLLGGQGKEGASWPGMTGVMSMKEQSGDPTISDTLQRSHSRVIAGWLEDGSCNSGATTVVMDSRGLRFSDEDGWGEGTP